jgi:hypothetical protein
MLYPRNALRILLLVELEAAPASSEEWASSHQMNDESRMICNNKNLTVVT